MNSLVSDMDLQEVYYYLSQGIVPRPVFLVVTISKDGVPNVAPYSFANVFSINPPIVGFATLRGMRRGNLKDTYVNLLEHPECTIQLLTQNILYRGHLSSVAYDLNVNEFEKTGLTAEKSMIVKPPLVAESPFKMECVVHEVVELGSGPGGGCLFLCKVVKIHANEYFRSEVRGYQPVGKNGGNNYVPASGDHMYSLPNLEGELPVDFNSLISSGILEGLNLSEEEISHLAMVSDLPGEVDTGSLSGIYRQLSLSQQDNCGEEELVNIIKKALKEQNLLLAWEALICYKTLRNQNEEKISR